MTDRSERYIKRVREYLEWECHDDKERADFLLGEAAKWEERYDSYIQEVDEGTYKGDATVFDFLSTIAAIDEERKKYSPLRPILEQLNKASAEMKERMEMGFESLNDA